jgi:hypothetical protein
MWRYNINKSVVDAGVQLFAGDVRTPCINSTGDSIAIQERDGSKTWISIISINGGTPRRVIENSVPMFFMDWPQGDYIFYNKGFPSNGGVNESKTIFKVNIKTGQSTQVVTFTKVVNAVSGGTENLTALWYWQMSRNGQRLVATTQPWHPANYEFSANDGILRNGQSGCSFGCSPTGSYTTNNLVAHDNLDAHQSMKIRAWDGTELKYLVINPTAGTGMGDHWNWQHFGVNSDDWAIIPYGYDGPDNYGQFGLNMVLYNWRNDSLVRVTSNPKNTNSSMAKLDWPADFWMSTGQTTTTGRSANTSAPSLQYAWPELRVNGAGWHRVQILTLSGRVIRSANGHGNAAYRLADNIRRYGVVLAQIKDATGIRTERLVVR